MASVVERWRRWTGGRLVALALVASGCALAAASASLWTLGTSGAIPELARSGRELVTEPTAWFVAAPTAWAFAIVWCGAAGALLEPRGSGRPLAVACASSILASALFAPMLAFLTAVPGLLAGCAAMAWTRRRAIDAR